MSNKPLLTNSTLIPCQTENLNVNTLSCFKQSLLLPVAASITGEK